MTPPLALLDAFASMFRGKVYNHRNPTQGDHVILFLYEDLLRLERSTLLGKRILSGTHVVNTAHRLYGKKKSRRGDGTFGELVPSEHSQLVSGYQVRRGPTATLEIGSECKVICVAQARQVGRVITDLRGQAEAFQQNNSNAISVAVVGVNTAPNYTAIEGASQAEAMWRVTPTTGKGKRLHPRQEASATIKSLREQVASLFDEFIILEFVATNERPYNFSWVDEPECRRTYSSALTRIARNYTLRFPD